MTHSPIPWTESLTPLIKAGSHLVQIGGESPKADIRLLSESNFQFALKSVNAAAELAQALERLLGMQPEESPTWSVSQDDFNQAKKAAQDALALMRDGE